MNDEMKRLINFNEIMAAVSLNDDFTDWLSDNGFFTAPASTKYHGAYDGGLFDHCLAVTKSLVEMTEKLGLQWQHPRSPYIVGMFHDLCKIDNYNKVGGDEITGEEHHFEYNLMTFIPGHGDKSVMMLARWLQLTEEEIICIRYHMGAYAGKEEWDFYDRAIRKYETVIWTHSADMWASKVKGI